MRKSHVQETSIQVTYTTIQVSHTRNMADDGGDNLAVAITVVLSALNDRIERKCENGYSRGLYSVE